MMSNSSKPTPSAALGNIPDELKELDQWVGWNSTKFPINARIGTKAEVDNPNTWSPFEKVQEAVLSGKYKGMGFVFTESDSHTGIDLDDVIDPETGEIKPEAQDIIDRMDSYTEISQSGKGIHIIIRGKKPGGRCRTGNIEIYDQGRYFALTGNLLGGRNSIEERQEQLDSLYADTFSGDNETSGKPVSDLVLDREAYPPQVKIEELLRIGVFRKTYEHRRDDLPSLSEYDLALASYAAKDDWSDQEIADLIISFRRRFGNEKDLKKALRPDYIPRVLAKVKHTDLLEYLPFECEVEQYGVQDPKFTIVIKGGERVNMGGISEFLSSKQAYQKLLVAKHRLSPKAIKYWSKIATELSLIAEVIPTLTRGEVVGQWVRDLVTHFTTVIDPSEPNSLQNAFSGNRDLNWTDAVVDRRGVIYVNLSGSAHAMLDAHIRLGQGTTIMSIAAELASLGFRKLSKVSVHIYGKRKQINIWVSPEEFISPDFIEEIGKDRKELEEIESERLLAEEAESLKGRAIRKANEEMRGEWSPL